MQVQNEQSNSPQQQFGAAVDDINRYFSGKELYGDNFSNDEIARWYADEAEAYAQLGSMERQSYQYSYHEWNQQHGYRYLDDGNIIDHVMAFGSAYGDELKPIVERVNRITMIDSSDAFHTTEISGKPVRYVKPTVEGNLSLDTGSVDLVTCFGVLHHIPNVTNVLKEIARTLKPGAKMLLREPIVSMGDWRLPRAGLTKRERGIPLHLLKSACVNANLSIDHATLCGFSLTPKISSVLRLDPYNSKLITKLDRLACKVMARNVRYHSTTLLGRIRPTCVFLVLTHRQ